MNTIDIQTITVPVGELIVGVWENQLCLCDWLHRKTRRQVDSRLLRGLQKSLQTSLQKGLQTSLQDDLQSGPQVTFAEKPHPLISQVQDELLAYFQTGTMHSATPLLLVGTDFQKQVWKALQRIPSGQTTTYSALAEMISNKKATRAVANAVAANAFSIFIPCHRVIGSGGGLVGYAGGLPAKEHLLNLERNRS
jgi:methylated-DNA-[protein]-cysteine S-methyltransferase